MEVPNGEREIKAWSMRERAELFLELADMAARVMGEEGRHGDISEKQRLGKNSKDTTLQGQAEEEA